MCAGARCVVVGGAPISCYERARGFIKNDDFVIYCDSGLKHLEGLGAANGRVPHGTGLECRLMGEVGKAVARMKMTRAEANEIVLKLLEKYEHVFGMEDGNAGKCFDEAYDMETIEPLPEWQQMYEEVKTELKELGLDL